MYHSKNKVSAKQVSFKEHPHLILVRQRSYQAAARQGPHHWHAFVIEVGVRTFYAVIGVLGSLGRALGIGLGYLPLPL